MSTEQKSEQEVYTEDYLDFHKTWENQMNSCVISLNNCRSSDEVTPIIRNIEELETQLRNFPYSRPEDQAMNLRELGDVLDEAKFKFTHTRKQELAEQNKLLQAQIDAWGLPSKPANEPFQVILSKKKGRRNSGDDGQESKKAKTTDEVETQNKFSGLSIHNEDNMEVVDPQEGTSSATSHPGVKSPPKKFHVPPINIDNVENQAALLHHLQNITKQKLEAKLIGSKFRIYPKTPYAYHQIRRYIEENSLESHTYMLPEDKLLRAVIRGLPTDMSPTQIIADLESQGFHIKDCHNMQSKKTGQAMPLFMLSMERNEEHKKIFQSVTSIGYIKCQVEALRKKYGPPQCFRCQGFFHSSKYCTRTPRCVKCAKNHLAKDCTKAIDEKPKCCLCEGEHPANYLNCPKNPRHRIAEEKEKKRQQKKPAYITPEPPKVNFWEQRAKTAAQRQQSTSTNQQKQEKTPTASTSQPKQNNNPETISDIFDELKNPAVQETFELLEEFIKIATTIPTRYGRLRAIHQLYVINLQETHLQPCHHLAFPNYNIYRTDRTCRGGGTAILIKRNIPHHEIVINNQSFETTAIKIERSNSQPITVISAYRSPRKPILVHDLHQLFRNQDYVLVAGDLNAKHASWSPIAQQNVAGHTIRRFCDSTGFTLNAPLEPTHIHKNLRNTVIDLAICKGMTITDVTSIPELSSDHNPVLFEVCLDNFTAPALSTYAFPNWKKFQDILTNTLPAEATPDDDSLYKIVKTHSNKNKTFHIPPIVGPMGLHYSTEDKVNLFADSLESSFQENPEPYDDDFIDRVEEKIESYMDRNARRHTAPLTSPEEVMDIILNLNNKKAPGKDGIKNIALKSLPLNAITYITKIFNRSLQFNYFPKEWKHAQITVLPKPKKTLNLQKTIDLSPSSAALGKFMRRSSLLAS
ncbi:nucleic-acid-binding protein from transposon X-element [Trichonephila clavipes]|nr:nucleic-acid-binding protein from transposon X-element [Trichonephila clavipes]